MNADELKQALEEATEGVGMTPPSIEGLASAGRRRRRQNVALSGVAVCVVLLAATVGLVRLAGGDGRRQVVETAQDPDSSTGPPSKPARPTVTSAPSTSVTTVTTTVDSTVAPTTVAPTTRETPPPTPSTAPPTTTTLETVPDARPVSRPAAPGDIDGDGVADSIWVGSAGQDRLLVRASLTTLGDQSVTIRSNGNESVMVMGSTDVDRDGYSEMFLRVGMGASTVQGTIIRLVDDRIAALSAGDVTDGAGPTFSVHGSINHVESFACLGSGAVERSLARPLDSDGSTSEVVTDTFRIEGALLVLVDTRTEVVPGDQVPDRVTGCPGVRETWY